MTEIIFSHGLGSSAKGKKISALATIATANGFSTYCVNDTDCTNPDQRAERLIKLVKMRQTPLILVGSSMGAYTSLLAAPYCFNLKGLFLIAPALYQPNYQQQSFQQVFSVPVEIIHGWQDEVIPWQNSLRYAQHTNVALHLINGDHRLHQQQREIETLFQRFLEKIEK